MKSLRDLTLYIGGAVLLAGCAVNPSGIDRSGGEPVPPEQARPPAPHVPGQGLELTAKPEKSSYVVGEPVYLILRLRNTGDEARPAISRLDPLVNSVAIHVTGPAEESIRYAPIAEVDYDEGMIEPVAPGEVIANVVPVFFGANGWTFREAGEYRLAAVYSMVDAQGRRQLIEAEPVSVEITPSRGAAVEIAGEDETAFEAGKFLLWQGGDHLEQGRAYLQRFVEQAPDSVVADYIHAAFARSYSRPFMDYRQDAVRPADCDRTMLHLSRIRTGSISDFVRLQNAVSGLRCAAREGDRPGVERYLGEAREVAGDDPAYLALAAQASRLARAVN